MDNSVEKQPTKSWITDALIIAVSPVIAYTLTFTHEVGFSNVFGVPIEFINLSLTNVCIVGLNWLMIILVIYFLSDFFFQSWPKGKEVHPIYARLGKYIPAFIIGVVFLIISGATWRECLISAAVLLLFISINLGLPLLTQRGKGNYPEKLIADESQPRTETLLNYLGQRIGIASIIIILVMPFTFWFSFIAGKSQALKQSEFLLIPTSPEMVVLRVYGDRLICAPFDRTTKKVQRAFTILKMAEDPKLQLHVEKVGPLRLENKHEEEK